MIEFGYARTSTNDQKAGLLHQQEALIKYGISPENLIIEEASAVKFRPALNQLLNSMRSGDYLTVTTLSRLARSTKNLIEICEIIKNRQCNLRILDFGLDTSTAQGKMVLTMLSAVSEFERELMIERQAIGVAKAKLEGKYKGRPSVPDITKERVLELQRKSLSVKEISNATKLGVSTVYKILKDKK